MSAPAANISPIPINYGRDASNRFLSLFGGVALLAVFLLLIWPVGGRHQSGGGRGLGFALGMGIILLVRSYRLTGMEFRSDGVRYWSYEGWFWGAEHQVAADQIKHFALCFENRLYYHTVNFKNGESVVIPEKYECVFEARRKLERLANKYGVEMIDAVIADVAIRENTKLDNAQIWQGTLRVRECGNDREIEFDGTTTYTPGKIVIFGDRECRRVVLPPERKGLDPVVDVRKDFWGKMHVLVNEVETKVEYKEHKECRATFCWLDRNEIWWSGELHTEGTPCAAAALPASYSWSGEDSGVTRLYLKLYRGLQSGTASPMLVEQAKAIQGPPQWVALVEGPASRFKIHELVPGNWAWIRLALSIVWVGRGPYGEAICRNKYANWSSHK